jgi:hypothetical protein
MSGHDFWGIITDPVAATWWRAILGVYDEQPHVPLLSPVVHLGELPGLGRTRVYLVRLDLLTAEQRSRLVTHIATRFDESIQDVSDHLEAEGLPIRASTCSVVINNPQRWC